jgi:magnesium transporter
LQSLSEFAGFLSSKVNFMLDATLGLINIEQNQIVKIFSVAAVIFLPPTLVASIYGMNFVHLPEKDWQLGYPFSIALMIISVIVPYWFCRRKGWL